MKLFYCVLFQFFRTSGRGRHNSAIKVCTLAVKQLDTDFTGLQFRFSSMRLSLAVPPWVTAISTGDGFGHHWGSNGT